MTKKYLLVFLAFISSLSAFASNPTDTRYPRQIISMDYLMESCTVVGETAGGMVPHFDCESFLYGVLDAHIAVRDEIKGKHTACFPAQIAPWQIYQLLTSLVPRKDWSKPAAPLIIKALNKHFPCAISPQKL